MDRRRRVAGTAAAAPALAAPAIAHRQNPEVRWRMRGSSGRDLNVLVFGAEQVSKRAAEPTDNRFQIRASPAGEIAPGLRAAPDQGQARPSKARARACHIGLRRSSESRGRGRAGPGGGPDAFSAGTFGGSSVAQL